MKTFVTFLFAICLIACSGTDLVVISSNSDTGDSGTDSNSDAMDAAQEVSVPETTCSSPYGMTLSVECEPGMSCPTYDVTGFPVHGICSDCKILRPFCLDVNRFVNCDCKGCGAPHDCRTDYPPTGYDHACVSGMCQAPW